MKRRTFLSGILGGGVAASTFTMPTPAIASGKRVVRLVTTWPRDFPGLGTGAQRVANNITLATEGKLKVKLYAAGELVKPFESFDAVSRGDAEMYHAADYYWTKKSKGFAFFSSVPFGMTSTEMYAWLSNMGGQELWDELAAGFNIKPFAAGSTGVQMGGWYNKEINNISDFNGLKIRMPGLGGEVMKAMGADAVTMPGGEILRSMRRGDIQATEWIGPWSDKALGLHKVAKYYYWPGFHEPGTILALGINKTFWDSLTVDQKSTIKTICDAENTKMLAEFNANNGDALAELRKKHHVSFRTVSNSILTQLGEASGDIVAQTASEDPFVGRIYNNFITSRLKLLRWNKYSEEAYMVSRRLPFQYGRKVSLKLNKSSAVPDGAGRDAARKSTVSETVLKESKGASGEVDATFERIIERYRD